LGFVPTQSNLAHVVCLPFLMTMFSS